ncbi:MAG TPA: hypothetical protein VL021_06215 [Brumimicrobium sp.]|nr:hypothetical protein [Brumimicrobium sp.]
MKEKNTAIGIIAYITLIGFIIAFIMNAPKEGKEKRFGAFHLRQGLGLGIIQAVIVVISNLLTNLSIISISGNLINILFLILAVIGIINAAKGEMKVLPVFGEFIQSKLANAFE